MFSNFLEIFDMKLFLMYENNVEIKGFRIDRRIGKTYIDKDLDYKDLIKINENVLEGFYQKMIV